MESKSKVISQPLLGAHSSESEQTSLLARHEVDEEDPDRGASGCFNVANKSNLTSSELYWNFVLMSIGFSVNHGCVVSCLAYSTTELGTHLGGYGSGVLYVFYALTALFLSKPVIASLGPKNGLLLGTGGYCVYVAAFFLAVAFKDGATAWIMFLIACAIGGCAGGILWTAQGRYFARNAALYGEACVREQTIQAQLKSNDKTQGGAATGLGGNPLLSEAGTATAGGNELGSPSEDAKKEIMSAANSTFAGFFAMTYLGAETMCKVTATAIFLILSSSDRATNVVFATYTVAAVLAVVIITRLNHLLDLGTGEISWAAISEGAMDAAKLCKDDIRLALLLPYQVNFGCVSTFVPYYIFGVVVGNSDTLGGSWVGCLSAVITLTGSLMGLPAAWLSNKLGKDYGKPVLMVFGGLCTAAAGASLFIFTDTQIGTWSIIIPLLFIYGIGRGTWENVNKAVVADLFSDKPQMTTSAFAAVSFSNGFSGSIAYFAFPSASRTTLGVTVVTAAIFGILCYLLQVRVLAKSRR